MYFQNHFIFVFIFFYPFSSAQSLRPSPQKGKGRGQGKLSKTFFLRKKIHLQGSRKSPWKRNLLLLLELKKKTQKTQSYCEKKLEEYKGRFNPKIDAKEQLDTIYKIAIAEELLTKREVNTWVVEKSLADRCGISNRELFQNAREVIEDYLKTGGENLEKVGQLTFVVVFHTHSIVVGLAGMFFRCQYLTQCVT